MASSYKWNLSHESFDRPVEPEYDVPYGDPTPPLTAFGNIQYLDMIKLIDEIWSDIHPEISFQPHSDNKQYDSEMGVIIYSVIHKVPLSGQAKPIHRHKYTDDQGQSKTAFTQSFRSTVRFTAIHGDGNVADEILERFEEFMMEIIPALKKNGLEEITYYQRIADISRDRNTQDLAYRATEYMIVTQKIHIVENRILEQYYIKMAVLGQENDATPFWVPVESPNRGYYNVFTGHGPPTIDHNLKQGDLYVDLDTGTLYEWTDE